MIPRLFLLLALMGLPVTKLTAQDAAPNAATGQYTGVYRVGGEVSAPKAIYAPAPQYSEKACKASYGGSVVLWLVVNADGLPRDIKVQRSLGNCLDEEAIKAVSKWRFQPATKGGQPVAVMINVEINFRVDSKGNAGGAAEKTPLANSGFDRSKGISLHMLPKGVADLGPSDWGLVVSRAGNWGPPQQAPVFQTTHDFLVFVRAQNQQVQENGVWIVVTDPDAYSDAEKTFLEDIKTLCSKEQIPLFISRAKDLPNGWKRYDK